ncbi:hypothetical protein W97_05587 [Coniosporium apollinis CBS 100218]|uniref:Uncharacterized protein n=1 Tax=Coniosporium apollinis (strain CBS 100218) TaxID=1168221 RepID=R7YWM0_CONA1|nr:uncharacterized protein W97_05587 [Coniosporium apollinis CBS 100218]EON66194.1 hypothetical protein W97_05587 [Coniosporium apollinis CBS 100218]
MAAAIPRESNIDTIFQRLVDSYNAFSQAPNGSPKAKAQLQSAAKELIAATQAPYEAALAFAMQNAVFPCFIAAGDCGILSQWPKETMTAKELAEKTGAERRLIARLMRVLVGAGVFNELGEELYSHNQLSTTLSKPSLLSVAKFVSPAVARLPEYLAATSYRNPGYSTEISTPFQFGNNTPLGFYQALAANDNVRKGFDDQMKAHVAMERAKFKTGFASMFDFEGEVGPLIESEQDVALVDVGGSQGHVLEDVRKHLPGFKGRLILEELPGTLQSITVPEGIEAVPYNFLESEQPIKGAACYLFRQIFLNWSDARGHQILRNTLPAMKLGYSRLLIMEPVPPPAAAPMAAAMLDIQMIQMGGGLRTEKQWRAFLGDAGFEVRNFWPSNSNQTVIEAVPKAQA